MDPYCKPSPSYTTLSISPTLPSLPSSNAQSPLGVEVSDEELQRISVRQLNQRLQIRSLLQTLSDLQARLQYYEPTFMLHDYPYVPPTMPMAYHAGAHLLTTATSNTTAAATSICQMPQQQ
ncbi:hypothetical protein OESDEN_21772 [Oesophagostomum dentatum]|uniref:Uncharacterized protein n=1 Tax=Oesophagostomum dentatum TaxID=61180 RepID=A0A0B1S5Y4_OESDE|nr:hypothetical protein OESDEN_21772 [Oesophagostomum dentatum]